MTTQIDVGVPTMTPGLFMRMAREHAGLNQAELAERLRLGIATVQRTEDGRTVPRLERVEAWARACGVSERWLQWNVDACGQPDMRFALRLEELEGEERARRDSNPKPSDLSSGLLTRADVELAA